MVMANPECVDDCSCQHIAPQILYELHFYQQVMNIMHLDLKRLDLNLLLVFEAVYRLRSVTHAFAAGSAVHRRRQRTGDEHAALRRVKIAAGGGAGYPPPAVSGAAVSD
ncbi:hypothetical protein M6G53_07645 [Serratia nevei]|uniref:hypothetical protein n=1 Tax=Serratia nevei TaxID=2703794 RepID=UPI00209EF18F|nr:hypothetical protein [Serratia nevei]MCP1105275.1 hypothetical protein [Serratia nevei]